MSASGGQQNGLVGARPNYANRGSFGGQPVGAPPNLGVMRPPADRGAGQIPGYTPGSIVDRFSAPPIANGAGANVPMGGLGAGGQFNPLTMQAAQNALGAMQPQGATQTAGGPSGFGPAPNAGSMDLARSMYGGFQNPTMESYGILGGGMGANGTPLTAVDTLNRPQLGTPQTRQASEDIMRQFVGQYGREQGLQMYRSFLDNQAIPLSAVGGGGEIAPVNLNRRAY